MNQPRCLEAPFLVGGHGPSILVPIHVSYVISDIFWGEVLSYAFFLRLDIRDVVISQVFDAVRYPTHGVLDTPWYVSVSLMRAEGHEPEALVSLPPKFI